MRLLLHLDAFVHHLWRVAFFGESRTRKALPADDLCTQALAAWYVPYLVGAAVMLLSTVVVSFKVKFDNKIMPSDLLFFKWAKAVSDYEGKTA